MIVNIRGTNGSGKSSIPMSMLDDPDMKIIQKPYKGKMKNILTIFPKYGWVALGSYLIKTGGLDQFNDNDMVRKVFWYALKHYGKDWNILMEGSIASTLYNTYAELFKGAREKYPDIELQIVSLVPSFDTCVERVYKRNGGKTIKLDPVMTKYKAVKRTHERFLEDGLNSWIWDNTYITDEKLIHQLEDLLKEHSRVNNS